MDLFTQLFGSLLAFVYHCFDHIVIYGYLSGLSRPERVVNFFHQVVGVPVVSREILSQRTADYQNWVEAFARNHRIPIEWAEKGMRKEDHVRPWQRRMARADSYGVYYILKSMEQGPTFRVTVPKYPVPRRNLWAIDGLNRVTCEGRKAGSASPDGTANCASARRIAVKPCACGAPLCGFGA